MKKPLLLVTILALGLVFTACQKPETKPEEKTKIEIPITENPTETVLESATYKITIPTNLISETSGTYGRIQNYTPDSDLYTLKNGEYYLEFISEVNVDEIYSKEAFRNEYKKIEEIEFNGKKALYGTDRIVAGDGGPGVGYYIENNLVINITAESDSGLKSAQDLLKSLTLK